MTGPRGRVVGVEGVQPRSSCRSRCKASEADVDLKAVRDEQQPDGTSGSKMAACAVRHADAAPGVFVNMYWGIDESEIHLLVIMIRPRVSTSECVYSRRCVCAVHSGKCL